MFYYKQSENPSLEVRIAEYYSESDFERLFLFIDALIDNSETKVVFMVNPLIKENFEETIMKNNAYSFYNYQIQ